MKTGNWLVLAVLLACKKSELPLATIAVDASATPSNSVLAHTESPTEKQRLAQEQLELATEVGKLQADDSGTFGAESSWKEERASSVGLGAKMKGGVVRQGTIHVQGETQPDAIAHHVRLRFGRIRNCYERARKTAPELKGALTMEFTIARDGTVTSVSELPGPGATGTRIISDAKLKECALQTVRDIVFPKLETPVKVNYTMNFVILEGEK
jgi:hypothetical protein